MKRAQVYFEDDEYETLREVAFKRRASVSSMLRHMALVSIIGKPAKAKKRDAEGWESIIGMVHESKTDVAERHDEAAMDSYVLRPLFVDEDTYLAQQASLQNVMRGLAIASEPG